ncbi:hypothetical protein B0J15DRAFT_174408 [Fusarium solani]|jgi:hypothetical protein|uniref:Uncharacterized protein n=1 Tax=Fusarium solani TaxID=169388 RepID=A0A9P9L1B4_FUSSL|nr:uncharacterized protein B0J15DRAFT_174408 [Fusarium solani]KAH7272341.1 hypothetical protein B0J15DRAFT_174408 [Fusarium solani]
MWVLKKLQRKKSRRRRFELVLIVSGVFPQSSPAGDAITPQVLRRDGCLSRATRDELLGLALTYSTGQFDASHPTGFGAPEEQHLIQGALHSHGTTAMFRRSCSTSPEGTHWHDSYQSPISHGCSLPLATASQDLLDGKTVDCSHHQPGQIQIVTTQPDSDTRSR